MHPRALIQVYEVNVKPAGKSKSSVYVEKREFEDWENTRPRPLSPLAGPVPHSTRLSHLIRVSLRSQLLMLGFHSFHRQASTRAGGILAASDMESQWSVAFRFGTMPVLKSTVQTSKSSQTE